MRKYILPLLLLLTTLLIIGFVLARSPGEKTKLVDDASEKVNRVIKGSGFSFDKNTPGYENLSKLSQGCPGKDCIPSIDNPKFETITEADSWLEGDDVVFVLSRNSEVRAYPQRILNWHEIVNDVVRNEPIAITFCPLCGSSLAFERNVEGRVLEFGVSGKLHNNDLVMYDRQTESLWQQITGEAIVGELFGKKLKQISLNGMRWSQFKEEFVDGQVLSKDTSFVRDYSRSPYGGYEEDTNTLFPIEGGIDDTLHPKTIVYGVIIGDKTKAYSETKLKEEGEITDKIGDVAFKIMYENGNVVVVDMESGDEVITTRLFWFAWKAFNPDTSLY